ncbi:MAG: APC family permease [bacterium]
MKEQGQISFLVAVLISINVIVGGGIYFGPQIMASYAGNFSFLGWIFAAILLAPIIWSVASAAKMFPGTGGFYNYCTTGINDTAGFIAIWAYFLGYTATGATLTRVLKDHILGAPETQTLYTALFSNLLIVVVVCALNLLSVSVISKVQSIGTILKLLPLFFVIVLFGFYWDSSMTFDLGSAANIGSAIPMAIFGFWGVETCCSIGHYLKGGPSKAFGVILTAFLSAMLLYSLFHFGLLHIMGAQNLATFGVAAFPGFLNLKSTFLASLLSWSIIVALGITFFNTIYGVVLLAIDNLLCLAGKRLTFFASSLTVLNRFSRPYVTIFVQGVVVFLLVTFITSKAILAALSNLGVLISFLLTIIAVAKVQIEKQAYKPLVITLLSIPTWGLLAYYSWVQAGADQLSRLMYTSPLLIGIVLGFVMFYMNKKK